MKIRYGVVQECAELLEDFFDPGESKANSSNKATEEAVEFLQKAVGLVLDNGLSMTDVLVEFISKTNKERAARKLAPEGKSRGAPSGPSRGA
jgi:hypothetical protein